jgi:hypothetical protein
MIRMAEYDRIAKYRSEAKEYMGDEILMFRDEIEKGEYPFKCLICFKSGVRYCYYWVKDYLCDEIVEGKAIDIFEGFIKRQNREVKKGFYGV